MNECEIQECLAPFNGGLVELNDFVLNAFKTGFLLIGYLEDCYAILSLLVNVIAALQIAANLGGLIYIFVNRLKNPNRLKITDHPSENAIPWLGSNFISLIMMIWGMLVPAIQIAFNLVWLSSVSTTLIIWHVWVEFPLAIFGIVLLRNEFYSWNKMFKLFICVYSGFFLNIFLVSLTSNPYIQGSLGMLALVSDVSNPIIYGILTYRIYQKVNKVRFGILEGVLISHLLNFYLPIIFCFDPWIMSLLYVIFQGVSFALSVVFIGYEIHSLQNKPIPSIF